jgi:hypothetical protein
MVNGQLFVDMNGKAVQVVEALSSDIAKLPYEGLHEGLYVVGSGSTGAAEALAVMVSCLSAALYKELGYIYPNDGLLQLLAVTSHLMLHRGRPTSPSCLVPR